VGDFQLPDNKQQPNWQPISQLPLISTMVTGMLHDIEGQHQLFLQAVDQPHILDDATIHRAQRVYQTQLDDLWLYETQCEHWLQGKLIATQRKQIKHLVTQVARLKGKLEAIMALLAELETGTIDKIMAKSDLELGMEFLMKQQKKNKK
jgi:hypothetical protein